MPRSALIVDDSRTALTALGRLLKAQGVAVDTVESGPEALDYLRHNAHPGVVFLDHMMPGMDGFETLGALKADARTVGIPVIMYTSKEGDAYMGQALAQGALGVLRKPVDPAELEHILMQLDKRRAPATPGATRPAPPAPAPAPRAAITGVIAVPRALRAVPPAPAAVAAPPAAAEPARPRWRAARWLPALLALVLLWPAAGYYQRYQQAEAQRAALAQDNGRLAGELSALRERVAAEEAQRASALQDSAAPREAQDRRQWYAALMWALNYYGQYGPNEEALNDTRLALVRELLTRLAAVGFRGTLRIETHVGEFCLTRDEQGNLRLPNDNQSILRCEVVTYPPAQAVMIGQRQSPAFARFLAERRSGPIQIALLSHGTARPLVPYPERAGLLAAGEWNQVARLNQRVEFALLPAP
jgi:CheY-like chemotaxis protein